MAAQKGSNLRLVLFGKKRTSGIGQRSGVPHKGGDIVHDLGLQGAQVGQARLGQGPSARRIAPP